MQDTLSAVPIKHVRINSGRLQKRWGWKGLFKKASCFSRFRKPLYPTYHYIPTHMCTHISVTVIKSTNERGQVLSQFDKAQQVKEWAFTA